MNVEHVPVESLHLDPANVRRHPERNLDAIKASLARFGQQKPIVVDAKGVVRAGNGTLEAARALGWETVAVVRTGLKGSEATAYAIADNRSAELAEWDDTALAETLRALQSEDFDLAAVGYSDEEVNRLIEQIGDDLLGETAEIRQHNPQPPPKMAWVLIGIPTVRFGEIAADVERIARLSGVRCETTANDG